MAFFADYRRERLLGFLHPWDRRDNEGLQTVQSLASIADGRITGVGLGSSRGKWGYLPFAHTDFIFSIIGEELGLIGAVTVVSLFAALAFVGFAVALNAPDRFGMLLALGVTIWLVGQAFINIGVALGIAAGDGLAVAVPVLRRIVARGHARRVRHVDVGRTPHSCVNVAVFAVISGGGTAGHVVPGLAVADALVERGHDPSSIHYVGSERGVERTMVPSAGFPLTLLPGRGIQRRLTFANVAATIGLLRAIAHAVRLVRRERPEVLLALGGYASVPAALGAALWRVPIVVAEQNAVPGAANRLVARFAKASAVSFPNTALPRAVFTGNPVRREVRLLATGDRRSEARVVGRPRR